MILQIIELSVNARGAIWSVHHVSNEPCLCRWTNNFNKKLICTCSHPLTLGLGAFTVSSNLPPLFGWLHHKHAPWIATVSWKPGNWTVAAKPNGFLPNWDTPLHTILNTSCLHIAKHKIMQHAVNYKNFSKTLISWKQMLDSRILHCFLIMPNTHSISFLTLSRFVEKHHSLLAALACVYGQIRIGHSR